MNSLQNKYDSLEQIIFDQGLRIVGVHAYKELDLLLIVLNNRKVLERKISSSVRLLSADQDGLNNYRLLGDGVGIHWPTVDEDLSLKGFLKEEFSTAQMVS